MAKKPVIIAVCGKGGVGKTSLSALITRMLAKDTAKRVLAIDADPAVGLAYSLGIDVTKTVDQIRRDLIEKLGSKALGATEDLIRQLDYDLFAALGERQNLAFLAIGRPEDDGCYCQVNALLRDLIKEMAVQFDAVVIDGEAGLEQINRRVMDRVTHLLMVSDASFKGRKVAQAIYDLGKEHCGHETAGLLFNRVKDPGEEKEIRAANQLPLVHVMHENDRIREFDRQGLSFFDLPWTEDFEQLEHAVRCFTGMADSQTESGKPH
jgi:CO dehydrogenase maturation factor